MAFTTIGSPNWGSGPTIGTDIAYESKRSGGYRRGGSSY